MRKIPLISVLVLIVLSSKVEASSLVGEWVCPDVSQQTHLRISADGTFSKRSTQPNIIPWSGTWKESAPRAVTLTVSPKKMSYGSASGFTVDYKVRWSAGKMSLLTPAGASFENCSLNPAENAGSAVSAPSTPSTPSTGSKPSNPFAVKVHQYADAIVSIDPRSIEIKGGLLDLVLTYDFDKPTANLFGTSLTAQHAQMYSQYDCSKRVSTMLRITATTRDAKAISYVQFEPSWAPPNPGDGLFNEVCARAPRIHSDYVEQHNNSTCVGACEVMRRNRGIRDQLRQQRCEALRPVATPLELSRAGCL